MIKSIFLSHAEFEFLVEIKNSAIKSIAEFLKNVLTKSGLI